MRLAGCKSHSYVDIVAASRVNWRASASSSAVFVSALLELPSLVRRTSSRPRIQQAPQSFLTNYNNDNHTNNPNDDNANPNHDNHNYNCQNNNNDYNASNVQ